MNTTQEKPGPRNFPASRSVKPVNFSCAARGAKTVQLAGNFNHWHPILMEPQEDGRWHVQMWLACGHHQYRFLVDGEPRLDLCAGDAGRDEHGQPVSLIAVV